MNQVAVIITNYNMVERCDALCAHVEKHAAWPHDLIVVDNGSDIERPSKYTKVRLELNRQTTGGWLEGLKYARALATHRNDGYLAYWFLITSTEFVGDADPLTPLAQALLDDPGAVGVHPALTQDSTTAWQHMVTRGGAGLRRTWMIDNIASLYRADWFDGLGWFDPAMKYAWGIDLETCYHARKQGRGLYIHEDVTVKKVTDIGYAMNRMNMTAEDRRRLAGENMTAVLNQKYGVNWLGKMTYEYRYPEMD